MCHPRRTHPAGRGSGPDQSYDPDPTRTRAGWTRPAAILPPFKPFLTKSTILTFFTVLRVFGQ